MTLFLSFLSLIVGIVFLIKGADYLVDGASSIAQKFGVSTLVIGLTVVAFGTSAPELAVNVLSAFSGSADIALGNINGSNIANILLILGITALFSRIPVKSRTVIKEIPFMLLGGVMLIVLMLDQVLTGTIAMLSVSDGIVLLGFFAIFMYYLMLSVRDTKGGASVEEPKHTILVASLFTLLGLAGLVGGGQLTVNGAVSIAEGLGVSQALIAVTLVAIGTSLPELVTSVIAAKKGHTDLAIGGVVGSNIFNILFVLGTTATVSTVPIAVSRANIIDAIIALSVMVLLLVGLFISKRHGCKKATHVLTKQEGVLFVALYIAYIVYTVLRG